MPLKKISELLPKSEDAYIGKPCKHPEHNPPGHVVLSPGIYEYECPGCGKTQTFTVPARSTWATLPE